MKAVRVHEHGEADVLRYDEVPRPEPGEGEVRVKIAAAGVNFIDIYHRKGLYPGETPFTLGVEGAGVVDAVGSGVSGVAAGDRIAYCLSRGAYADYAIVPAARTVLVPDGVDLGVAATLMVQGLTAHYLTHTTYPLQPGDVALVHAAAGGVGLLLCQIASRRGARVIGTVSTAEKEALARAAGADEVIRYTEKDFHAATMAYTDGRGVPVVYDSVGKTTFDKSLACLRPLGYLVLYGQSSGPVPPVNPQILNTGGSLFLTRPSLGHYVPNQATLRARAADLFNWHLAGELNVRIDQRFPLDQAADAHRYIEARRSKGKVLLIPEGA